jgi:hypothetical protein
MSRTTTNKIALGGVSQGQGLFGQVQTTGASLCPGT